MGRHGQDCICDNTNNNLLSLTSTSYLFGLSIYLMAVELEVNGVILNIFPGDPRFPFDMVVIGREVPNRPPILKFPLKRPPVKTKKKWQKIVLSLAKLLILD